MRKYPFEAELKDDQKVIVTGKGYKTVSFFAYSYLSRANGKNIKFEEIDDNTIKLLYNNKEILLKYYALGDIISVFVRGDYEGVDVNEKR